MSSHKHSRQKTETCQFGSNSNVPTVVLSLNQKTSTVTLQDISNTYYSKQNEVHSEKKRRLLQTRRNSSRSSLSLIKSLTCCQSAHQSPLKIAPQTPNIIKIDISSLVQSGSHKTIVQRHARFVENKRRLEVNTESVLHEELMKNDAVSSSIASTAATTTTTRRASYETIHLMKSSIKPTNEENSTMKQKLPESNKKTILSKRITQVQPFNLSRSNSRRYHWTIYKIDKHLRQEIMLDVRQDNV